MANFYIDNDVALEVAEFLSAVGHTAGTARAVGREGSTDEEQLLVASQGGRIFVTHSEHDFISLHDAWQRWSAAWGVAVQHAGVLIVPQGRRYGMNWAADAISPAVIVCLEQCAPVAGHLFRRKQAGWQRRVGRDWVPCRQALRAGFRGPTEERSSILVPSTLYTCRACTLIGLCRSKWMETGKRWRRERDEWGLVSSALVKMGLEMRP